MHRHPAYYAVRNHIIDFLMTRSKSFDAEIEGKAWDPRNPPIVNPAIPEPTVAAVASSEFPTDKSTTPLANRMKGAS